jgi:ubiquinone biosynthesis accessory factor UbiJ
MEILKKLTSSALKTALNTLLQLDPASTQRLRKLQGKIVSVELLPFHYTLQIIVNDDSVHIQEEVILESDITIRGTPLQMTALAFNQHRKQQFFAEDVIIEGDATLAQDVLHLFNQLQIDWEELLSNVVGDVPAYHIGRVIHRAGKWLRDAEQSLTKNVDEYVHEEAQWFPTREALQDLFDDIDTLRMDIDRVEARIGKLHENHH